MTVTYSTEVATGKGFGNFWKLLGRWRGSAYKVVIPDLIVYSIIYATISISYRHLIKPNPESRVIFEKFCKYFNDYSGAIPLSFVLGFYIAQIVTRWWNQFLAIPWPDQIAILIASLIHGDDDETRIMKRSIIRYINLAFTMAMVILSPQARARFPSMEHFVEAGLLFPHEREVIDRLNLRSDLPKYWIPLVWAENIVTRARKENKIREDLSMINIMTSITAFRSGLGTVLAYNWICVPLVYTQVVTLVVYLYFGAALFGKQFLEDEHELDMYVPIFLFLEFFFYTGWLKVAETMVNPFGEDDDDFEVNWIIDRNMTISFMIVDDIRESFPDLNKDCWWDEVFPRQLPYTAAAKKFKKGSPYQVNANYEKIGDGEQSLFLPEDDDSKSSV